MKRLLHVVSFASDLEVSKRFYRDGIGLAIGADTPFMVNFATEGAGLVLLAVPASQRKEVELCFESENVTAAVENLRGRGVEFIDELRHLAFGSVIHFRDPEGNLLSLLQPGSGAGEPRAGREAQAMARRAGGSEPAQTAQAALALAERGPGMATGPALSTAIVNARDLSAARAYYSHLLALKESVDSPSWVQYDTGEIRLALYSRRDPHAVELHHTQPVSFGFTIDHLEDWMDEARKRGVEFLSTPADEGFGLTAELVDPEGNIVVVREPVSEQTLEERLAEAWEDEVPHQTAMRSPVRKAMRHASWVAMKPDYKPVKKPARSSAAAMESVDGAADRATSRDSEPARAHQQPRTIAGPKRPRIRSAAGRRKKAEAQTLGTAKKAAAKASRSKPLKRAASKPVKAATKKVAAKKAARKRPPRA